MTVTGSSGRTSHSPERPYLYLLAVVAPIVTTLLTLPVLTRLLSAADVGLIALLLLLGQLISVVLGLGVPGPLTRSYFSSSKSEVESVCNVGALLFSLIALVASLGHLAAMVMSSFSSWILGAAAYGFLWAACVFRQVLSRASGRAVVFAAQMILGVSIPQVFGATAVLINDSLKSYISGMSVGIVLAATSTLIASNRARHVDRVFLVKMIRVGLPTIPHGVALFLFGAAIRFDASVSVGLEGAAQLQVAALLGQAPLTILGALNNSWSVGLYRQEEAEWSRYLRKSLRPLLTLAVLMIAVFTGLSRLFVGFLAGSLPGHELIVQSAFVISLSAVPLCCYLANMHVLIGLEKTRILAWATPLALSVGLLLGHTIGVTRGVTGFALTMPFAYCVLTLLTSESRRRVVDFRIFKPLDLWFVALACTLISLMTIGPVWSNLVVSSLALLTLPVIYRHFERSVAFDTSGDSR